MMQYGNDPWGMVTRPFGIGIMVFLLIMLYFSVKTTKSTKAAHADMADIEASWGEEAASDKEEAN